MPSAGGMELVALIVWLAFFILPIAGIWKTLQKAGEPGWAALIPLYNLYRLTAVGNIAGWWALLSLIPIINIYAMIKIPINVARAFGKGWLFGLGISLVPWIGWPVLGFGDYEYQGA